MATVTQTLIEGLNQKHVEARVLGIDATQWHFGKYFPIERSIGFNWATLEDQVHARNVAADIHSDNATIIRKSRPIFQSAKGDIPYIATSRDLNRAQLKEFQNALKLADTPDLSKLVKYWGEDIDFCFNAVQAELEYIAWALFSNAGKLDFTTANNATFANEFSLDYQVDDKLKLHTKASFAEADTDIIEELRTILEKMTDEYYLNPRFIFMNRKLLHKIVNNEKVIKLCNSQFNVATDTTRAPNLKTLNEVLPTLPGFEDIQIREIHQTISREDANGNFTSGNPFADNRLVITETEKIGHTAYDILEEPANNAVIRTVRKHTVVKKYGTIEPTAEVTIAQADAIPVLDVATRSVYVKTDGQSW